MCGLIQNVSMLNACRQGFAMTGEMWMSAYDANIISRRAGNYSAIRISSPTVLRPYFS